MHQFEGQDCSGWWLDAQASENTVSGECSWRSNFNMSIIQQLSHLAKGQIFKQKSREDVWALQGKKIARGTTDPWVQGID